MANDRSTAYPVINLEKAVGKAEKLKANLGKGQYSRQTAAHAMGYGDGVTPSGLGNRVVAALVQYGLLRRAGTGVYEQTELCERILLPVDDAERKAAIAEAAASPHLFAVLTKEWRGKALPAMLPTLLARGTYGVNEKVAAEVAGIFRKTLEYAGMLVNGVVGTPVPIPSKEDANDTRRVDESELAERIVRAQQDNPPTDPAIFAAALAERSAQLTPQPTPEKLQGFRTLIGGKVEIIFDKSLDERIMNGDFKDAIAAFKAAFKE